MNDFNRRTLDTLGRRGITLIGLTVIPGEGPKPLANGQDGYCVDDNGTHRVWTLQQVLDASKR